MCTRIVPFCSPFFKPNLVAGMVFEWGTQFMSSSAYATPLLHLMLDVSFVQTSKQAGFIFESIRQKRIAIKQCLDVLQKLPKLGEIFNGLEEEEEEEVTNIYIQ